MLHYVSGTFKYFYRSMLLAMERSLLNKVTDVLMFFFYGICF